MTITRLSYNQLAIEVADRSNGWIRLRRENGVYVLQRLVEQYGSSIERIEAGSLKDCQRAFFKIDRTNYQSMAPHQYEFLPSAKTYFFLTSERKERGAGWMQRTVTVYKIVDDKYVLVGEKTDNNMEFDQIAAEVIAENEVGAAYPSDYASIRAAAKRLRSLAHDGLISIDQLT